MMAFLGFVDYSSSSMLTTCSDTCFAVLQDVGIILSGNAKNNHIICGFLSMNYPWGNKSRELIRYTNKCDLRQHKRYFEFIM